VCVTSSSLFTANVRGCFVFACACCSQQICCLLAALIHHGAWACAKELIAKLESAGCMHVSTHAPIRRALLDLVRDLLQPLYDATVSLRSKGLVLTTGETNKGSSDGTTSSNPIASNQGANESNGDADSSAMDDSSDLAPTESGGAVVSKEDKLAPITFAELPSMLEPLRLIGCGLSEDPRLFAVLCRLLQGLLKADRTTTTSSPTSSSTGSNALSVGSSSGASGSLWEVPAMREAVLEILETCLLPACARVSVGMDLENFNAAPCNPGR